MRRRDSKLRTSLKGPKHSAMAYSAKKTRSLRCRRTKSCAKFSKNRSNSFASRKNKRAKESKASPSLSYALVN